MLELNLLIRSTIFKYKTEQVETKSQSKMQMYINLFSCDTVIQQIHESARVYYFKTVWNWSPYAKLNHVQVRIQNFKNVAFGSMEYLVEESPIALYVSYLLNRLWLDWYRYSHSSSEELSNVPEKRSRIIIANECAWIEKWNCRLSRYHHVCSVLYQFGALHNLIWLKW